MYIKRYNQGAAWPQKAGRRPRATEDPAERAAAAALLAQLDAARERAGLSKTALAARAGLSGITVRKLFTETGANPGLKTVTQLAAALGLQLELNPASPTLLEQPTEEHQPKKR